MADRIDPSIDYAEALAAQLGRDWPKIRAAQKAAAEVRELLCKRLADAFSGDLSGDLDIVAFGSLARGEWTSGSDVDWTLLIDGQAMPEHRAVARTARTCIEETEFRGTLLPKPGAEGIFGNMAFSHDIIHHIGGQADSNRNTTQRVLLLLEAVPLRVADSVGSYERVVRSILYRYLHDDTNFVPGHTSESRIPRFLLNDVVRYWRTMCVDFAYKEWEQAGDKWALRNVKLRMPRKLLFVSALLTVFSCYKNPRLGFTPEEYIGGMQDHLIDFVRSTPLNILLWTFSSLSLNELSGRLLDAYEEFLAQIDEKNVRDHLSRLDPLGAYQDETFLKLRNVSHDFQSTLTEAFFRSDERLREFIVSYGVF